MADFLGEAHCFHDRVLAAPEGHPVPHTLPDLLCLILEGLARALPVSSALDRRRRARLVLGRTSSLRQEGHEVLFETAHELMFRRASHRLLCDFREGLAARLCSHACSYHATAQGGPDDVHRHGWGRWHRIGYHQ